MDLDTLLVSAKSGDQNALNQLLAASQTYAMKVVDSFLGTKYRSRLDAEDVVQEVLFKVVKDLTTLNSQTWDGYLGWLSFVCRNTTYNAIKSVKATSRGADSTEQIGDADFRRESLTPEEMMETREILEQVDALAGRMGQNTKGVVTLLAQGYSYDEIANSLGLTLGACYSLVKRFRAKAAIAVL